MIGWLLKLLGIATKLPATSAGRARWGHGELAAIGLALLVPTAWFIVRRQRRNLPHVSPAVRQTLSACRIGVLLLLVMVLGAPYLHIDETLDLKPAVALIVDDSASMHLLAGPFDRAEAALGRKSSNKPSGRQAMPRLRAAMPDKPASDVASTDFTQAAQCHEPLRSVGLGAAGFADRGLGTAGREVRH